MKSGSLYWCDVWHQSGWVDVVLAAIDENMVAQQASLTSAYPCFAEEEILSICRGSS